MEKKRFAAICLLFASSSSFAEMDIHQFCANYVSMAENIMSDVQGGVSVPQLKQNYVFSQKNLVAQQISSELLLLAIERKRSQGVAQFKSDALQLCPSVFSSISYTVRTYNRW